VVEGTATMSSCRTISFPSSAGSGALGVPVLGLFIANSSDGSMLQDSHTGYDELEGPSHASGEGQQQGIVP